MVLNVACSHRYGRDHRALTDVDLEFHPGVTGLVGVNGAGKSTLLGALAGVLRPTQGSVTVDGHDLYGRGRRRALRSVGFMPQSFDAPAGATAYEVVSYLGWLRGLPRRAAQRRASVVLQQVGLASRRDSRVHDLSGGMRRRLAFAQSVVADPTVLLLDEPTTGLDPEQRAALREIVRTGTPGGVTVISSHLMEDIGQLVDRLVVLEEGRTVFDDTLAAFRELPGYGDEETLLRLIAESRRSTT